MPKTSRAKSVEETKKKSCGCRKGNCSSKSCGCVKRDAECNNELCKCLVESCQNRTASTNKAATSKPGSRKGIKKTPKDIASASKSSENEKFTVKDSGVTPKKTNKRVPRSIFSPESSPDTPDKVKKTVPEKWTEKITVQQKLKKFINTNEDSHPAESEDQEKSMRKTRAEKKTFSEKKLTETKIPASRSKKKASEPTKSSLKKDGSKSSSEKRVRMKSVEQTVPEKKSKRLLRRSHSVDNIDRVAYRTRSKRKLNFNEAEGLLDNDTDGNNPDFSSNKSLIKTNDRKRKSASINDLTRTTEAKARKLDKSKEPSAEKGNSFPSENRDSETKKKESVSETRPRRNQVKSSKPKDSENGSRLRKDDSDEKESVSKSREEPVFSGLRMSPSTGVQPKSKISKKPVSKKEMYLKVPDAEVEYYPLRKDDSDFGFKIRSKIEEKNKIGKEEANSRRKVLNATSPLINIEKRPYNLRRSHSMNDIYQIPKASSNTKLSHSSKETEVIPSSSNRNKNLPPEFSSAVDENPGTSKSSLKRKSVEGLSTGNRKKGKLVNHPKKPSEDSSDDDNLSAEVFKPIMNSTEKVSDYEESDSDSNSHYGKLSTLVADEISRRQNNYIGRNNLLQVPELQRVAQREPESRAMEINLMDKSSEWEDTP